MRLKNKVAIITGSASGFGKGIAKKFTDEGAKLIMVDLNSKLLKKVSKDLSQDHFIADVSKVSNFRSLFNYVYKKYNKIDIIINNAGITHKPKFMETVTDKEFDQVFNVNAKSVYYCAKFFIPKMKKNKKGVILNVASTAGLSPRPKLNWYNASKGWMITATKAMAIELAPFNVRVNAIAPVAGTTPLLKSFMGGNTIKKKQAFLSTIPMGRFSTPQDMGNAACFLCSDEAIMIRLGIIGSIGSGKSFVSKLFKYPVFNADDEVKYLYKNNKNCFRKLKKKLPKFISSFPIKKKELINAINSDTKNLERISSVMHPMVRKRMNVFLKKNNKSEMVVLDIPLLIENKLYKNDDILIFINSHKKKIIKRLKKRSNYNKNILKKLIENQHNLSKKRKLADYIVENNYPINIMKAKIKKLKEKIFDERNST